MTLQDIFDQLAHGELSQIFDTEMDKFGEINEEKRPKLIHHIQMALTDLHTNFLLREREFLVELTPGKRTYALEHKFAASNIESEEPVKYIDDSETPFTGRLLLPARIYNDDDDEVPLNDLSNPDTSIHLPSNHIIKLPKDYEGETLRVVYHEDHPLFDKYVAPAVPFKIPVELPSSYLTALLYFVASRVMNPIGISPEFHEGNNYFAKYQGEIARLKSLGIEKDNLGDVYEADRFYHQGWV